MYVGIKSVMIVAIEVFQISDKLKKPFVLRQSKQPAGGENLSIGVCTALIRHIEHAEYQNDLLSVLSSRRDLYLSSLGLNLRKFTREAVALHGLNHIFK
jgi:U3 small nucleolar RNA-associated protein 25